MVIFCIFTLLLSITTLRAASVRNIVDLSYSYDKGTPNFPLHTKFVLIPINDTEERYGTWVGINDIHTSEHSGTHIDAPQHVIKNARTVDNIAPEILYRAPGVKIDIRSKLNVNNVNYAITAQDIEEWIELHGPLPDGVVILFQTGYGERAQYPDTYSGVDADGNLNFPGLGKSAAEFIVKYKNNRGYSRGVVGVGMDVMSLDIGHTHTYPAHYELLGNDIYGLENVANVHMLPDRGFELTISPMKIGHGSGGPTRIFAEITENSAQKLKTYSSFIIISFSIIVSKVSQTF